MKIHIKNITIYLFSILCSIACLPQTTGKKDSNGPKKQVTKESVQIDERDTDLCPKYSFCDGSFPDILPRHLDVEFWLDQTSKFKNEILSISEITRHNAAVGRSGLWHSSQWNLFEPFKTEFLEKLVSDRLKAIETRLTEKTYVDENDTPFDQKSIDEITGDNTKIYDKKQTNFRVATDYIQIRCAPYNNKFFTPGSEKAFDRNACSSLKPQEVFETLGETNDMFLIRTSYSTGWIDKKVSFSPIIPPHLTSKFINGEKKLVQKNTIFECKGAKIALPQYSFLRKGSNENTVKIATTTGFCEAKTNQELISVKRNLTRQALLKDAFSLLNHPYGFGGEDNGIDCSRFIMDLLEGFDLTFPRPSIWQKDSGSYAVDVENVHILEQKIALIEKANQNGIVLLYFPGHIMLYLGKDENNNPMVIHSLGEHAKPCKNGMDTIFRTKKVVVTDLSVGYGSQRKSFIERITRIVVLGPVPPMKEGEIIPRNASYPDFPQKCTDSVEMRIFSSPRRALINKPVKIIATGSKHEGPRRLQIKDPKGNLLFPETTVLQGPPYSYITTFVPQNSGNWTISLGDGNQIYACDTLRVFPHKHKIPIRENEQPYWTNRWKWEQDTENYYSAFIEYLFSLPSNDQTSWRSLSELTSNPKLNLLHNHLGMNEDDELNITPDCADLPNVLRAYFAWKNNLPFGVRPCSRGRENIPPKCGEVKTNLLLYELPEEEYKPHMAFEHFARVIVGWTGHSGSSRTHYNDNETDYYPVSLSRNALTPGTIFTDPYGHIMIITSWYPQPPGGFGIMMAADGQPDSTIGRRRFARGTFLFDHQTKSYSVGFKKFRPVFSKKETIQTQEISEEGTYLLEDIEIIESLDNAQLAKSRVFSKYDKVQYKGTQDAFYNKIDALINPNPVHSEQVLKQWVETLFEGVNRRVTAVALGEEFVNKKNTTMEMPEGYQIFETTGPWEDFSTPSRDMRLLIVIDALLNLPELISKKPSRFGLSEESDPKEIYSSIKDDLNQELSKKHIQYINSAQKPITLSLLDITNRKEALEMAYNPNDCIEKRWGAALGSEEMKTCKRHAPEDQVAKMKEYRNWFKSRQRPPR